MISRTQSMAAMGRADGALLNRHVSLCVCVGWGDKVYCCFCLRGLVLCREVEMMLEVEVCV